MTVTFIAIDPSGFQGPDPHKILIKKTVKFSIGFWVWCLQFVVLSEVG